ncbi:DUF2284 domain-containing protein [Alkalibacter rhizosphaerae]|uniref:DUF2284 domain-containing protein n=1 Tax=Alkalibacter rhizosphaerae TaxID=2815577 RepID=A0A974XHX1_9FIRM|nr:DUF2284 domain-containing protein [Alkalibacter rhizosphaerae]QSX08990.1 DUF2284 domain-containing protein [Alkalibacter rhizosphaerae]
MNKENLESIFKELEFDEYKELVPEDIIISKDVFYQCERNTCGSFGTNHGCPPHAGSEEERKNRVFQYKNGYMLSMIVPIKTRKDMIESMEKVANRTKALRKAVSGEEILVMGAGPCTVCKTCTALEGKPCRFPEKIEYSMEGSGIDVVRMSMNLKMTYNAGAGNVGYFTLVLYNKV